MLDVRCVVVSLFLYIRTHIFTTCIIFISIIHCCCVCNLTLGVVATQIGNLMADNAHNFRPSHKESGSRRPVGSVVTTAKLSSVVMPESSKLSPTSSYSSRYRNRGIDGTTPDATGGDSPYGPWPGTTGRHHDDMSSPPRRGNGLSREPTGMLPRQLSRQMSSGFENSLLQDMQFGNWDAPPPPGYYANSFAITSYVHFLLL
jgi:hypothetical protein